MTILSIPLRKLIQLFFAEKPLRIRKLRDDIRTDRRKEDGEDAEGGDFFGPFWADAKKHVLGDGYLPDLTTQRISKNLRRERLYRASQRGFLGWWNERRRWRNEPLSPLAVPARAKLLLPALGATVKVDNLMGLDSGSDFERLIYPYFAEEPVLPREGVRLTLWAMREALPSDFRLEDMRVLDVMRSASFGTLDEAIVGDEAHKFELRYRQLIAEWETLKKDYD